MVAGDTSMNNGRIMNRLFILFSAVGTYSSQVMKSGNTLLYVIYSYSAILLRYSVRTYLNCKANSGVSECAVVRL